MRGPKYTSILTLPRTTICRENKCGCFKVITSANNNNKLERLSLWFLLGHEPHLLYFKCFLLFFTDTPLPLPKYSIQAID